jgi:hypothetical protein
MLEECTGLEELEESGVFNVGSVEAKKLKGTVDVWLLGLAWKLASATVMPHRPGQNTRVLVVSDTVIIVCTYLEQRIPRINLGNMRMNTISNARREPTPGKGCSSNSGIR